MENEHLVENNGSWFNEVSYCTSDETAIHEHVVEHIATHPEMDSPFFVTNLSDVLEKYNLWKKELPNVELYYAMKACSEEMVLKLLASLGASFECASKAEIESVVNLGVSPDKIMYSNPFKFVSHLKYAASIGLKSMVYDTEDELLKIHQHYPSAKLAIRVRPASEMNSYVNMSVKFGCNFAEAETLLKKAKELAITVEGISFHVGHCTESPYPYEDAISVARQVFDCANKIGHEIEFIDIGGGFQGQRDKRELFLKVAATIKKAVKQHFPEGIRVMAEPGQFVCVSASSMYTQVIGTRPMGTEEEKFLSVYLNTGNYGGIPNCNFQFCIPKIELINSSEVDSIRPIVRTKFWGPTGDPMDKIVELDYPTLKMGDWLRFVDMGAYTMTFMTEFNGFKFAKIKYVASPKIRSLLEKHVIKKNGKYENDRTVNPH